MQDPWDGPIVGSAPKHRIRGIFKRVAAPFLALTLAASAGFAGGKLSGTNEASPPAVARTGTASDLTPIAPPSGDDLSSLYARVSPSVVQVNVAARGQEGTGSGLIVDATGLILTNNHVVDGVRSVEVVLSDGTTLAASVVGSDPTWDLAIVRLAKPPQNLVPAQLGDSDSVVVGQKIFVIGSPFGLSRTLTSGIVSGVDRTFSTGSGLPLRGLIQTDASINPGNSGGPVFDLAGRVVGIATAIESPVRGSVGIGFAVPINHARSALPDLSKGASVEHPFLGVQADAGGRDGVIVQAVTPGSSAEAAGLLIGDRILAVDGIALASIEDLAQEVQKRAVGDVIRLRVRRGSETLTLSANLKAYRGS